MHFTIQATNSTDSKLLLALIGDSTPVFDKHGQYIGTVKQVHLGTSDNALDQVAPTIPKEIRVHLLQQGFLCVSRESGASDCYVTPDQMDALSNEGLILRVGQDEVIAS